MQVNLTFNFRAHCVVSTIPCFLFKITIVKYAWPVTQHNALPNAFKFGKAVFRFQLPSKSSQAACGESVTCFWQLASTAWLFFGRRTRFSCRQRKCLTTRVSTRPWGLSLQIEAGKAFHRRNFLVLCVIRKGKTSSRWIFRNFWLN